MSVCCSCDTAAEWENLTVWGKHIDENNGCVVHHHPIGHRGQWVFVIDADDSLFSSEQQIIRSTSFGRNWSKSESESFQSKNFLSGFCFFFVSTAESWTRIHLGKNFCQRILFCSFCWLPLTEEEGPLDRVAAFQVKKINKFCFKVGKRINRLQQQLTKINSRHFSQTWN